MISAWHLTILCSLAVCPLPAAALCVVNGTDKTLYFTVEATETGQRHAGLRGPGETLCIPASDTGDESGIVAAFEAATSIEGCSRLATGQDTLLAFARFDRCTWASHLDGSLQDDG